VTVWIASRRLSSGAHSRDPLARNDGIQRTKAEGVNHLGGLDGLALKDRTASRRRTDRAVTVPFGRQGTGWEVAYAALFLISNESSYVNAHTLFLDAGHMAGILRS
jgi:NAD(P)-dependent dehydrogenase (short-subunit alcohol dehydrogenase family)